NGNQASDFTMSQPAFVPERHEVWFSDGTSGFYALRVNQDVWPGGTGAVEACTSKRFDAVTFRLPRGAKLRRVSASLGGRALHARAHRRGRLLRVTVRLPARRGGTLVVRARLASGRTLTAKRPYHPC